MQARDKTRDCMAMRRIEEESERTSTGMVPLMENAKLV